MGQIGFFEVSKRYTGLDAKNEPLAKIDEVIPWGIVTLNAPTSFGVAWRDANHLIHTPSISA